MLRLLSIVHGVKIYGEELRCTWTTALWSLRFWSLEKVEGSKVDFLELRTHLEESKLEVSVLRKRLEKTSTESVDEICLDVSS